MATQRVSGEAGHFQTDGASPAVGTPAVGARTDPGDDGTSLAMFRTALALERTTLAWIRTALTSAAFGSG